MNTVYVKQQLIETQINLEGEIAIIVIITSQQDKQFSDAFDSVTVTHSTTTLLCYSTNHNNTNTRITIGQQCEILTH